MKARFPLWPLLASLVLAGACNGNSQCLRHSDCARDETCDFGTCVMKPTPDDGTGDTGGTFNGFGGRTASGGRQGFGGSLGAGAESGAAGDGGAGG